MSIDQEPAPVANVTEPLPNIQILLPPFDFIRDTDLKRGLQECRDTLIINFRTGPLHNVPITCRKILESVLMDVLTALRPEDRAKIRRKELHFLVSDFSGIATPTSVGQARMVQVLGNIARIHPVANSCPIRPSARPGFCIPPQSWFTRYGFFIREGRRSNEDRFTFGPMLLRLRSSAT